MEQFRNTFVFFAVEKIRNPKSQIRNQNRVKVRIERILALDSWLRAADAAPYENKSQIKNQKSEIPNPLGGFSICSAT